MIYEDVDNLGGSFLGRSVSLRYWTPILFIYFSFFLNIHLLINKMEKRRRRFEWIILIHAPATSLLATKMLFKFGLVCVSVFSVFDCNLLLITLSHMSMWISKPIIWLYWRGIIQIQAERPHLFTYRNTPPPIISFLQVILIKWPFVFKYFDKAHGSLTISSTFRH